MAVHISLCVCGRIHKCGKNTIMCMRVFVCAGMRERSVSCTVCLTTLSLSVCMHACVRAHARLYGGGGVEEPGLSVLDQHHSDWEDPVLLLCHMYTRLPQK